MARSRKKAQRFIGVGDLVIGLRERKYVNQVLDSNRLSYGPMTQRFEELFAREHGCRFAIFMNSGTSALQVALQAMKEAGGWKDGDEVLVPAVTFVATSNIVIHNRLKPVFVDVDPRTYNLDPKLLEAKITRRTRAIIPVHLLGLPADMDAVMRIARRHKLKVLEDSCETMFARYKGRPVGSLGHMACFSTYIAHYIVAGVGGFVTTNDPDLALRVKSLMNHGRDSIYLHIDDDKGKRGKALFELVSRRFSFTSVGHSFRATELEAAIGLAQLERKDDIVRRRLSVAHGYLKGLAGLEAHLQLPMVPEGSEHVYMLFPLVVKNEPKRGLIEHLESNGVETRDLLPLLNQPVYRRLFGDLEKRYPVARFLNQHAFYIGCHQYVTPADRRRVCGLIRRYFQ